MARRPDNNGQQRRYLGVRNRLPGRYGVEVTDGGSKRRIWLGTFDNALVAALAYDKATRRFNGPRAKTNFPLAFEVPDEEEEDDDEITVWQLLWGHHGPPPAIVEPPQVDLELRLGPPGGDHRQAAARTSSGRAHVRL